MTPEGFYLYGAGCFLFGWICHMIFEAYDRRQEKKKEEEE